MKTITIEYDERDVDIAFEDDSDTVLLVLMECVEMVDKGEHKESRVLN